jgi:transposase
MEMKKTKGTPRKKDSIKEQGLHLAFELSESTWKLGFSDRKKMRFRSIPARDLEQLKEEIEKAKERFKLKGEIRILSCYVVGSRMWWWTHRVLKSIGARGERRRIGSMRGSFCRC